MFALVYAEKLKDLAKASSHDRMLAAFDQIRDNLEFLDDECSASLMGNVEIYGCSEPEKLMGFVEGWNNMVKDHIKDEADKMFHDGAVGEQFKRMAQTLDAYKLKKLSMLMNNDAYAYGDLAVFGMDEDHFSVFVDDVEKIREHVECYAIMGIHVS